MSKTFPWYELYPDGVTHEIGDFPANNVAELLGQCVDKYKDKIAYSNFDKELTYNEIGKLSTDFASYLQSIGLKKGDRIAIQMPNLLQYPIAMFGAIKAGLIVVNTNPLYTPREAEHQFKDAGVDAIVILANFASNLEKVLQNVPIKHIVITEIADMVGGIKGGIMNFVVKHIKKMVPPYSIPQAVSFKKALSIGSGNKFNVPEINLKDNVFLQYTGGTTGVSKGAELSHGNIIAHTLQCGEVFKPWIDPDKQEIMVTAIPMYHIFALAVNGIFGFAAGMYNVLITNPRDMDGFVKELSKHKFSIITGVNTLFNGLLNNPGFKNIDFSGLKGGLGGGMAVQDFVARKWKEVTGADLIEGYGLSETSPVLCVNPFDGNHRMGYIGLPTPSTEVGIFDDAGNQLPPGEIGEICARGPQVMKGYWNRDNAGVFFHSDWFKTGDMGIMESNGFFKIVDRKKEMILV
ncbi:MAG: AMP-binding protein, partial [Cyclobacteriaceae bacterium]|nr:AMP-binding protein [Cyclobacteriaceae bacterium]